LYTFFKKGVGFQRSTQILFLVVHANNLLFILRDKVVTVLITVVVSDNFPARVNYSSPRFCYIFVAVHPKSGDSLTGGATSCAMIIKLNIKNTYISLPRP